jgi:hypothetical protein
MNRRPLILLAALAAILAVAVTAVAGAHAPAKHQRAVKVARGATTVKLTATLPGVTITPLKPAKAAGGGIAFPIALGRVKADLSRGVILHVGGLKLVKGSKTIVLRRPRAVLHGDASRLVVRVKGGRRLALAKLDLTGVTPKVEGRKVTVTGVKLTLTAAASKALSKAFGVEVAAGTALGTADVQTRIFGRGAKHAGSTYHDPFSKKQP